LTATWVMKSSKLLSSTPTSDLLLALAVTPRIPKGNSDCLSALKLLKSSPGVLQFGFPAS
jgi:hypothetical protein